MADLPVSCAFHLRFQLGDDAVASTRAQYVLDAGPYGTVVGSSLADLDRDARLLPAGVRREDWTDPFPAEVARAHELVRVARACGRRAIVESSWRNGRGHARVSAIVGDKASVPIGRQGRSAVLSADGLAGISADAVAEAFATASARAADLAAAPDFPGYSGLVSFSPAASGVLLHEAVGHLVEADNYVRSFRSLEQRIGPDLLSARDLGLASGADDEGSASGPVDLVRQGNVVGVLTSRKYAALSGRVPTGHALAPWHGETPVPRLARLLLEPGDSGDVAAGLHVESVAWGRMNPATREVVLTLGRTSLGVGGEIRMGLEDLLGRLAGVGSDVEWHPSLCLKHGHAVLVESGAPTTVFADVPVGVA
ncbi:metallopeptidase TldD-related protein [Nonomuraea soli]|uniref:Putative Zn-dependent protease n=1 Tax=Nonomuraea soli TaxID=1032476 RepID=A0A7W0HQ44_9ACTN|nr:metallopeptidase TldD-related protein [Nonomuraea soli]MBA2891251.1 putative Zn-dependent protease [Nonomuraea soli]